MSAALPRRWLMSLVLQSVTGAAALAAPVRVPAGWKPDRDVEIIVGTDPGTGFDRLARLLQAIWRQSDLVAVPVTVLNKPGGSGTLGYLYFNEHSRTLTELAIIAPLLLTNNLTGSTSFSWHDLTPLCVLVGEEIMTAVPAESPIHNGREFAEALKADPSSIPVALSGVGGQNHIVLGLVGNAAGADIRKLKVVGFIGSGEAVTAAMGGHVGAVVAPPSSLAAGIESGRLRGIGVASERRLAGVFAQVPTWREQGLDVLLSNWRGMAGPKGMPSAQIAYWSDIFGQTVKLKTWQDEVARSQLTSHYLDTTATNDFLAGEDAKLRPILEKLGFAH